MLTITTNSFENDVLRADKPVLVDFWAQWCPYCRRIAPAFDKVGEQYTDTLITGWRYIAGWLTAPFATKFTLLQLYQVLGYQKDSLFPYDTDS